MRQRVLTVTLALVAMFSVGCAQTPVASQAPFAAGMAAQAAKSKLSPTTQALAEALLEEAFPTWEHPKRHAFSSVGIPGSHKQPVAQKTAGVDQLTLKKTGKTDQLSFRGLVKTEAQGGGQTKFSVEGTIDLAKEKVTTKTIRYIP